MTFVPKYIALALLVCFLSSGCTKRYWHRVKIYDFKQNAVPVKIRIVNRSPDKLDKEFEEGVKKACLKQLKKEGFKEALRDSPRYEFILTMMIDTFSAPPGPYYTAGVARKKAWKNGDHWYYGGFKAPAIIFHCNMNQLRPSRMEMWDEENDLYFLNNHFRDILRSRGMVRYIIRTAYKS